MMNVLLYFCSALSAVSFLWYAVDCLTTVRMKLEFERYGLGRYRILTGILQICGAVGLGIGYAVPLFGVFSGCRSGDPDDSRTGRTDKNQRWVSELAAGGFLPASQRRARLPILAGCLSSRLGTQ